MQRKKYNSLRQKNMTENELRRENAADKRKPKKNKKNKKRRKRKTRVFFKPLSNGICT